MMERNQKMKTYHDKVDKMSQSNRKLSYQITQFRLKSVKTRKYNQKYIKQKQKDINLIKQENNQKYITKYKVRAFQLLLLPQKATWLQYLQIKTIKDYKMEIRLLDYFDNVIDIKNQNQIKKFVIKQNKSHALVPLNQNADQIYKIKIFIKPTSQSRQNIGIEYIGLYQANKEVIDKKITAQIQKVVQFKADIVEQKVSKDSIIKYLIQNHSSLQRFIFIKEGINAEFRLSPRQVQILLQSSNKILIQQLMIFYPKYKANASLLAFLLIPTFPNLKKIYLNRNYILSIQSLSFINAPRLQFLSIGQSLVTNIKPILKILSKLKYVYFPKNHIQSINQLHRLKISQTGLSPQFSIYVFSLNHIVKTRLQKNDRFIKQLYMLSTSTQYYQFIDKCCKKSMLKIMEKIKQQ